MQYVYITLLLRRLWKGVAPLWGRQIPYTMMKFGKLLAWLFAPLS